MHCSNKRTRFCDFIFDFNDNVYEPAEDTILFAENLDVKEGEMVLDMGTGCGILGILAARKADGVVAVDLNPFAIHCAKENSKLNGLKEKIDFIETSLFAALKPNIGFDLILFNAPYLPTDADEVASWIGRAWAGGAKGREVVDRFISEAPDYLKHKGKILLMQSTLTGVDETIQKFSQQGLIARVKVTCKLPFFETLTLIEAKAGSEEETI
jgi:release factor glutamine methyltransferase